MIDFQFNDINQGTLSPQKYFPWIKSVIETEGFKTGQLLYHFCSDRFLLKINRDFLHHDYLTDIITFPLSNRPEIVSGEIFISLERVMDNANRLQLPFLNEFARVLVHGVLHLLGYYDHSAAEKKEMRAKEDYYLSLLAQ